MYGQFPGSLDKSPHSWPSHVGKSLSFLLENLTGFQSSLIFYKSQLCVFCFYIMSSSIFKPESYFPVFSFDMRAARVSIVSRVHTRPFFPPSLLPLAKDTVVNWSPSNVLDLVLILLINLTFAIGHTYCFCFVDVPYSSECVLIGAV